MFETIRTAAALALLLVAAGTPPAHGAEHQSDVLVRAMEDALERSLAKLEIEELGKPYFIAYRVDDRRTRSASASFGSLLESGDAHRRTLHVELRLGSYDFDNTNFLALPSFSRSMMVQSFGGVTPLPLDDDYRELRRQIWLATDAAYKEALEDLAKKKAALQNKTRIDELPDFSRAEPLEIHDEPRPVEVERSAIEGLATRLSALFRQMPDVFVSQVDYRTKSVRSIYVNSEGTRFTRSDSLLGVTVAAATQAEDGMKLEDFVSAFGQRPEDLPSEEMLVEEVKALGARLAELRTAALLDRYNGPVLFEGQAAAELFAQAFAPQLAAQRRPVYGDERMEQFGARISGSDFQDRLGARVLPRFLSVSDDPTREELDGVPLLGGFEVDFEGVAARPKALVERGYLKTMLVSRSPVVGIESSSGNMGRGGVVPSNLLVSSGQGASAEELMDELELLVQDRGAEFGVLVRRLGSSLIRVAEDPFFLAMSMSRNGEETRAATPTISYKVYPDGRRELVRNIEISGLSQASFKEIVAAGAEPVVYSLPVVPKVANPFRRGPDSGPEVVTVAVPALLFEELTMKKPSGEIPRLPVAPHPAFAEDGGTGSDDPGAED